jgi:integrase
VAARSEGQVLERHWKSGRGYALRVRAYGARHYLTLGSERDGWDRRRAEEELENVLADVRRGIWVPPQKKKRRRAEQRVGGPAEAPIFGPFARGLVASRKGQVSENTTSYEEWALGHLLPYFAEWPVNEIQVEAVDDYRLHKVSESEARAAAIQRRKPQLDARGHLLRPLSPASINKTINFLQWVLSVALEYGHVSENAAVGRRRRLRAPRPRPVHLDTAGQIEALLEAAAELDRDHRFRCSERHAIIATLIFAGPRARELCSLLWRDVDLANGRIFIGRSKTEAGLREIAILPILRDVLAAHKASAYRSGPEDLVFPSGTGGRRTKGNLREHVLLAAFGRASEILEGRREVPLPKGLTAHKLRHTFASVLVACGEDPISVMAQIGHTDPNFTLRVYTHLMSRDSGERERLKALVRGEPVLAHRPAAPELFDHAAYERPIMLALKERGGSASCREILAAVGEAMAPHHTDLDLQRLPSGSLRWQARVAKARTRLVKRGWLRGDSARGRWELSSAGMAKICGSTKPASRQFAPADGVPATELAVAP